MKKPPRKSARKIGGTSKVSVTMPTSAVKEVKAITGHRGFSAFIGEAVELRLQRMRIERYLDELDQEYGPIPEEVQRRFEERWREVEGSR